MDKEVNTLKSADESAVIFILEDSLVCLPTLALHHCQVLQLPVGISYLQLGLGLCCAQSVRETCQTMQNENTVFASNATHQNITFGNFLAGI